MKLQFNRSRQPAFVPNWHPNFRNTELLPDLKVVRTTFFINATCIAVASAALLFTGYREYQAFSIRSAIAAAESRMAELKEQNDKLLGMNRDFMAGAHRFEEAQNFTDSTITGSQLLIDLSASLPSYMDFTSIAFESDKLVLGGVIRGASETASQRVSAYLDTLRQHEEIGAIFVNIELRSLLRDARTQGLSFEILLKQPEAPKTERKPRRKL